MFIFETKSIFFYSVLVIGEPLHKLSGYSYFVVKNTQQKAANLALRIILAAGMVPWWFLEVQSRRA